MSGIRPRLVVVDDHDEVLEEIHGVIRSLEAPLQNLAMIHFDAHPDLSVPKHMSAKTVFQPEVLYEHLASSDGGISEWIIPLVFGGHVCTVWWVRPHFTESIPDGHHEFLIGAVEATAEELAHEDRDRQSQRLPSNGNCESTSVFRGSAELEDILGSRRIRVTSDLQYFCEDPWCVADKGRMVASVPLCVLVGTLTPAAAAAAAASVSTPLGECVAPSSSRCSAHAIAHSCATKKHIDAVASCDGWVLDVCLDFFGTYNPFAYALEHTHGAPILCSALQNTHAILSERQGKEKASLLPPDLSSRLATFRELERGLQNVLNNPDSFLSLDFCRCDSRCGDDGNSDDDGAARAYEAGSSFDLTRLRDLFKGKSTSSEDIDLVINLAKLAQGATPAQITAAVRMVPCANLPHYPSTPSQAFLQVQQLQNFLLLPAMQQLGPPSLVTIARSSGDPFTPPERLRWLEFLVTDTVKNIYNKRQTNETTTGHVSLKERRPKVDIMNFDHCDHGGGGGGGGRGPGDNKNNKRPRINVPLEEVPKADSGPSLLSATSISERARACVLKTTDSQDGDSVWVVNEISGNMTVPSDSDGIGDAYRSPSHLLADAVEHWAHGGGIKVGLGCRRWLFHPGMLYGSKDKWWTDGERRTAHEGLDFFTYEDSETGATQEIQSGVAVRPMLPGTVIAIFPDFMSRTVVVAHDVTYPVPTCDHFSNNNSSCSSSNPERTVAMDSCAAATCMPLENLTVFLHSSTIKCEAWPADRRLLTIYAHIDPDPNVHVGMKIIKPISVLGTVTSACAPRVTASDTKICRAPSHLHLTTAWTSIHSKPPESWADLCTSGKFVIVEPPIPAGSWSPAEE